MGYPVRLTALGLALASMLLLSACTPGGGQEPSEAPTPMATPSDPSTPEATAPTQRLPIDCATLLPADLIATTIASGLNAVDFHANPSYADPAAYAVLQLGGWACTVNNGIVTPAGGTAAGYKGVTALILPEAATQFAVYEGMYPGIVTGPGSPYGESSNVTCFGRGAESMCSANILVNGFWIDLIIEGIDVPASMDDGSVGGHVEPLISNIVTPFNTAGALEPAWIAPADTLPVPSDCNALATAAEVQSELGYTAALSIDQPDGARGGWGLRSGSAQDAGVLRCLWMVDGSDEMVGSLSALPGGEWAFDASAALMTAATLEHTVVAPIAGVERATFGCQTSVGSSCRLNLVVGGNWYQMVAVLNPGGDQATLEAQMAAFAAIVVAHAGGA